MQLLHTIFYLNIIFMQIHSVLFVLPNTYTILQLYIVLAYSIIKMMFGVNMRYENYGQFIRDVVDTRYARMQNTYFSTGSA